MSNFSKAAFHKSYLIHLLVIIKKGGDTATIKGTILHGDVLCDLVPFLLFKKCEKTYGGVLACNFIKSITAPLMFFTCFVNCTNGTKSCKTSYVTVHFSLL